METTDLTIEILKGIRSDMNALREDLGARIDQTNGRLDQTNRSLDRTNEHIETMREELSRRLVDSEIRTSTALTDLAGTVRDLTSVLRGQSDLRPRVERCERDIDDLRRRASGG